ncbi:hypothetical protein F5Y07DRAFT_402408 [Xylaria sp. FL0933]|nr:hypothetical protein F5Y07DRAFT_402408 [Xylaria sp. FL0933]
MASSTYEPSYDSLAERRTGRVKIGYEAGSKTGSMVPSTHSAVDASRGRNESKDRSRSRASNSASTEIATTHSTWQDFSRALQDNNHNHDEAKSTKASNRRTASMHHNLPIRKKINAGEQVMSSPNNQPTDEQSGYEGGSEGKERKAQRKKPLRPRREKQLGAKKRTDHRKERLDPKRSENIPSDESSSSDDY